MRLREQSEIGWLMLQLIGAQSLPFVTRDAQKRADAKERLTTLFRGRRAGMALVDTPSDSADAMAYAMAAFNALDSGRYTSTLAEAQPGAESLAARAKRLIEKYPKPKRRGGHEAPIIVVDDLSDFNFTAGEMVLMGTPSHAEDPEVHTFSTTEGLWWLSYADEHRCAGVVIVRVTGEQSSGHAAETARALGIAPEGEWEIAAIRIPEEESVKVEAYAGRFLTTAEAEAALDAQSIRSFEEETGLLVDTNQIEVVQP